jgi:hypothetical protein
VSSEQERTSLRQCRVSTLVAGLTKNPRITADDLSAKSGLDVYVPDLFDGEPVPTGILKNLPETPGGKTSLTSKVSR